MIFNYSSVQVTDDDDYLIKLTVSKKGIAIHYENLDWHRQIESKDIADVWAFEHETFKDVNLGNGRSGVISKICNTLCIKLKSGEQLTFKPFFNFSKKHFDIKKWWELLGFYEIHERRRLDDN